VRSLAFSLPIVALVLLPVRALACDGAHVTLELDPSAVDAELASAARAQLRRAHRPHDLAICTGADRERDPCCAGRELGSIRVVGEAAGRARITLHDPLTAKEVERTIDVMALPADTRGYALAVAIEELLRASWLELALLDRSRVEELAAPAAVHEVERALAEAIPAERRTTLALRGALDVYGGGVVHLGGDLLIAHRALPWLELAIAVGGRRGVSTAAPHGVIDSSALAVEISLAGIALTEGPFSLAIAVGAAGGLVVFEGVPIELARGASLSDLVVAPFAAVVSTLAWGPLELRLGVGGGYTVLGLAAADSGARVVAAEGALLRVHLGVGARL
jgi:hypothetical protein